MVLREGGQVNFGKRQVTIHPCVGYYSCEGIPVRHSVIVVSDDSKHDYHSVEHYLNLAYNSFSSENRKFEKVVVFSDGCSSQYKGKGTFADLSLSHVPGLERHYFGIEHGKGDGEIGILNRALDRAIASNAVITNAEDTYTYCVKNLVLNEPTSKRTFLCGRFHNNGYHYLPKQ
ncbi:MAG: hypothetical protein V3T88_09210 [Nitrosomonadaceae bacterium]